MDDPGDWVSSTAFNTWLNVANTSWTTTTNWSAGSVPTLNDNVGIPDYGSSHPAITTTITCNNLVIEEGVSLTFDYNGSHTIHGNVYNIGTTNLNANTNLTITGTLYMLHNSIFNIKPKAALTVDTDLYTSIWGLTGTLTLESTTDGTGSLIVEGSTTGNVAVKRYISGHNDVTSSGWHLISSPVQNQNISTNFVNVNATPISSSVDFYRWQETEGLWINIKAENGNYNQGSTALNFSNDANPQFEAGMGYLISYQSTQTSTFDNSLLSSNVNITGLTNTDGKNYNGWHLLGNPFTSALDFNTGSWNKDESIGTYAQVWNESSASYKVLRGEQHIPSMNGFMVYTSANGGSLTIPRDAQVHSDSNWYKSNEDTSIIITVSDMETGFYQETIINSDPNSTNNFDHEFDSYFIAGFAPQFYSFLNNNFYALNCIPIIDESTIIPLGFRKNNSNSFKLKLTHSDINYDLYIKDLKLNTLHSLSFHDSYIFSSENNDSPNRFELLFRPVSIDEEKDPKVSVWCYGTDIKVLNQRTESIEVNICNILGQTIYKQIATSGNNNIDVKNHKGIAFVTITNTDNLILLSKKIIIQ